MKYKTLKEVTEDFDEIFEAEKETDEIHIKIGDYELFIAEQQLGIKIEPAHVMLSGPDICTHSMVFDTFINHLVVSRHKESARE